MCYVLELQDTASPEIPKNTDITIIHIGNAVTILIK